jgi:transcriptional regulator with XRE-family HTH domain
MTTTLTLTLGETLRVMRERAGFKQTDLARYLELGRTTVIRYEADLGLPKWKDIERWALICDHDPQIVRELWELRLKSGCIYEALSLFEVPDVGDVAFRDDRGRYRTPLLSHPPEQFGQDEAA